MIRLDHFDVIEWWDVLRSFKPEMTFEEACRDFEEFLTERDAYELKMRLN